MGRRQRAHANEVARSRVAALDSRPDPPEPPGPVLLEGPQGPAPDDPPEGWQRWLPSTLRGASVDLGSRGVRALAVVAVLVAAVAGVAAWRARPAPEPVTAAPSVSVAASPSAGPTVVAVSGKVRRPGLVRLRPGARVADAIEAAGGALPGADLSGLNLARKVVDGELIAVGVPAPVATGAPAAGGGPSDVLDLNTATADQFDGLPGVGPVLAERIVAYRTEHGGFRSVDQLREVDGIGDSRFEKLKPLVRV